LNVLLAEATVIDRSSVIHAGRLPAHTASACPPDAHDLAPPCWAASFKLGIMEFRCPDPSATVRAANVKATLDAFKLVPSVGNRLIEKHKLRLDDLRPDNLVPVQRWLDALAEIQSVIGHEVLRSVGAAIIGSTLPAS
jgi:hypothetical protein